MKENTKMLLRHRLLCTYFWIINPGNHRVDIFTVLTVTLLYRFADFVEGSPHLMPNEVSVHVQEYGFGGSLFEDDFFDTDDDDEDTNNYTDDDDKNVSVKRPEPDLGAGDTHLRPAA